jgi:glycosyltransferase involved in cell wall biosynthesis
MAIHISVVIPTYKRPALLKRCLDALMRQTLGKDEFEVIVVSDGPDEETETLIKTMKEGAPEFRYAALPEKKGPAAARNLGWKTARSSIIAFTDDDCLPDSNWLKAALERFQTLSDMVYSGKLIVPLSDDPTDHEINTANLQTAEFITANCFCTKAALDKAGGFDERYGLAWREDSDLQFRFIELGIPIGKIEDAVVVHPVRKAPWGFSMKEQKKGFYNALLYKKYPKLYRQKIQPAPAWDYYVMIACIIVMIAAALTASWIIAAMALLIWLVLLTRFILKRLQKTSHRAAHVKEIIITSLAIPFLSVYWQLYGAVKYRVWLL